MCIRDRCLLLPASALAADWDGKPNRYRVRIDAQASRATVDADLWQQSDMLSMYNVMEAVSYTHLDVYKRQHLCHRPQHRPV